MTARTLALLDRLVAFPTISSASNLALIDFVAAFLRDLGARIEIVPNPDGTKAGLFAAIGPPGAGVLLSAHSDVVPVDGQTWQSDPFRLTVTEGRAYGRGTTDMKGYLAAMLAAAERAAAMSLRAPLKLAISYDEEVGCVGIAEMIDRLSPAIGLPRACLVGEPTDMQVAIGHKGKRALRAMSYGEAGHSALAPRFANAIHGAAEVVQAIRAAQAELVATGARDPAYDVPYSTLHVGMMRGGTALNIVPDRAEVVFELRHLAEDDPDAVLAGLASTFAALDARVELQVTGSYPGLAMAPETAVVAEARRWAGGTATTKVAFGTEAGYFHGLGVPTVVCGPGSMAGQGHKANEFIALADLAACDAMLSSVLADLAA